MEEQLSNQNNLYRPKTDITPGDRAAHMGQVPRTLWFTGLSGSGKSTLANEVEKSLLAAGHYTMLLDGDAVRMGLNANLGFSSQDRVENIRRVAEVAKLMNEAGLIVLTSFISPFREDRQRAREIIGKGFVEIYVATPLSVCEERDVKGLYKKAREGKIPNFTGISSPYEPPLSPEITVQTQGHSVQESAQELLGLLAPYLGQ
jgi:bifunctional enzyme CysN/CysC